FVMGDNRGNSSDSRSSLGPIKRTDIVGKAFVKIFPPGRWGIISGRTYCTDPRAHCKTSQKALVLSPVAAMGVGSLRRRHRRAA
ncbi:MAG: S26 family signal peptidase, partial [Actinomycetota bacterium]